MHKGEVHLTGELVSNRPTLYGIQRGMAYVPEDRTHVGSSPNLSVTDNVIMKKYRKAPISRSGLLDMNEAAALRRNSKKPTTSLSQPSIRQCGCFRVEIFNA